LTIFKYPQIVQRRIEAYEANGTDVNQKYNQVLNDRVVLNASSWHSKIIRLKPETNNNFHTGE
jgi:hypothetical protein